MFKTVLRAALSLGLILSLTACLEAVPEDEEQQATQYGTLYLGSGAAQDAHKKFKEIISFDNNSYEFLGGYWLIDRREDAQIFHITLRFPNMTNPSSWADTFQRSPADNSALGWKKVEETEDGVTVYDVPIRCDAGTGCTNGTQVKKVALRIFYDSNAKLMQFYLASPSSFIKVMKDKDIENRYLTYQLGSK